MSGFIYLIKEREFVKSCEQVYKIGKTAQTAGKRFSGYPKDSIIEIYLHVTDHNKCESDLIRIFDGLFKKRTDIGTEYYEGNRILMLNEIIKCISPLEENETPIINNQVAIDNFKTNVYYPIYYFIQSELSCVFMQQCTRNICVAYNFMMIVETGGQPTCPPHLDTVNVDIDKLVVAYKKAYGKPSNSIHVTCEQYYSYYTLNNVLGRKFNILQHYETERKKLPNPSKYFCIKMKTPLIEILSNILLNTMKKCIDYDKNGPHNIHYRY